MTFDILISIIALGTMAAAFYTWYRISLWRKEIQSEVEDVEESIDSGFLKMKKKIEKQIEMLDNQPGLSEEEKEIRDRLYKALEEAEGAIKKEVDDVKNEIK